VKRGVLREAARGKSSVDRQQRGNARPAGSGRVVPRASKPESRASKSFFEVGSVPPVERRKIAIDQTRFRARLCLNAAGDLDGTHALPRATS